MRGRKPIPTGLKLLKGNTGHRRMPDPSQEPQATPGAPDAPAHIVADKEALAQWHRWTAELVQMRVMTHADRETLALMCDIWSRYIAAQKAVAERGILITTAAGNVIQNPALSIANKCSVMLLKFCCEFGLTPSSRTRISMNAGVDSKPVAKADVTPFGRAMEMARRA